ncbi:UNVERIFIED_CONTAM: putative ribonuclease H protein [Sesamum radiatum]|uniref:Ribonuclease H protein n=1 Tax=Sesamum radiatum TaxID=300843 RepID=A0AAW2UPX3_SESRA
MDVLEIQEVFKTSEEDEVTPTFNRYESLEDHELMSDLEEHVLRDQVARNSTTEDEFVPEQDMLYSDSVKMINFKELVVADTTREPAQCNPENLLHDSLLAHNRLLDPAPPLDHLQSISFSNSVTTGKHKRNISLEHPTTPVKSHKTSGKGKKEDIFYIFVYAKCHRSPRRALWQDLLSIAANKEPWIMGGDFNIVLHIEENQGGSNNILGPMEDFSGMVMESALIEKSWELPTRGYSMYKHQQKLYRIKDTLKDWNRQVFGNIFSTVEQAKEATTVAEKAFDSDPSDANLIARDKHNAILIQALTTEAKFLKQKSCCKWLEAGERNSKYFHALVKKKRIRDSINRISVDNLDISNPEDIKNSAADFFCNLLSARATPFTEPEFLFQFAHLSTAQLYKKLAGTLPMLISPSQSGFVPGRLIGDNILLAQEMIHLLDKRNDAKHRKKPFNAHAIISKTWYHLQNLCRSNIWKPEHLRGDAFAARLLKLKIPETRNYQKSKIVYWLKPDPGWVKLKTDGASKGNPGLAGAGGIVKDYTGKAIFVFSEPIGFTNNMVAEMHAVLRGLGICLEKGFSKV